MSWWTDTEGFACWEILAYDGLYVIYLLVVVVWVFDVLPLSV